jgi:acyl-CoA reductase-like NAD-dependent aldehyde dehydrogenase
MPLAMLANKIVLAMLAGNTIVAKPAPTTPLTTLQFALEANKHLPPGVFNVITDQNDLGSVLSTHPDVAKITFTGSTMTGKKVMESASNSLKRVTLELGGNDAAIVLDDMEPKEVAAKLFAGAMINCGQICLAIKRTYVPSSIYDEVCDELVRLADNMVVGDGSQPGTQMGPLQNHMQYERVLGLIESARDEGTVIAGGDVIEGPGYFVRPTIVRDLDDAIARANDTHYGLGGSVWTSDPKRGTEVA